MNASRPARLAALAVLGALALTLGIAVGGSRAADAPGGQMPICDPPGCYGTTTGTTATTPTTTPTTTNPTPGGGGAVQCSDGRDNDGDGLVDANDPGCAGPQDNNESDDPALSSFVGTGDAQFARLDEGVVGTDSSGAAVRCARLGAERYEHGFLTKGWSFFMTLRWCWTGRTIVSWDSWNKWLSNHIPFPASLIYPLDWRLLSESSPTTGLSQTSAFAQAKVQVCPVRLPTCFSWLPWLRFTMDAQGHALCQSDVRTSIPDCKA